MSKLENILGIDIGTSSLKLIYNDAQCVKKVKVPYDKTDVNGWWKAVCDGTKSLDLHECRGIGLSSQVGTYITDSGIVIGWQDSAGADELDTILGEFSRERFVSELNMPHPRLSSYPLPRLLYIKKHYPNVKSVCQPKDIILEKLTGKRRTDKFSYRGAANLDGGFYSMKLIGHFGLEDISLPSLDDPCSVGGKITAAAAALTGIPEGTPVVIGCNDFFAGLIGMGVWECGDAFDITGTSEHVGLVRRDIPSNDDSLVSGGYFNHNVHYGVTASSGCSIDFGMTLADVDSLDTEKIIGENAPVFLPYLKGERAPIWDTNARGVFFGIEKDCTKEALAYAVAEGVCFSLYHIYETMGKPEMNAITVSGGAGKSRFMNELKASLFSCPVKTTDESDASAYGAQLLASVGIGRYENIASAISENVRVKETFLPNPAVKEKLYRRFKCYRELYPALKDQFGKISRYFN